MELGFFVLVLVCNFIFCHCGVIDIKNMEEGIRAEQAANYVNYDGLPEVHQDGPRAHDPVTKEEEPIVPRSVKQKRCPSTLPRLGLTPDSDDETLGARNPVEVQRRDIQTKLNKNLCSSCKTTCKVFKTCEQSCNKWCEDNTPPPNDTVDDVVPSDNKDSSSEESNEDVVSLPSRFGGSSEENNEKDSQLTSSEPGVLKKVFPLASFASGPLKELICNLLGIFDTSDIDKLAIWATTFSNEPPKFGRGYKKNVSPSLEKLSDTLNEELQKVLELNKKHGKDYLSNFEVAEVAKKVLETKPDDIVGKASKGETNSLDELVPDYPLYTSTKGMKLNPDVIQGTPDPKLLIDSKDNTFPTGLRIGAQHEDGRKSDDVTEDTGAFDASYEEFGEDEKNATEQPGPIFVSPDILEEGDASDEDLGKTHIEPAKTNGAVNRKGEKLTKPFDNSDSMTNLEQSPLPDNNKEPTPNQKQPITKKLMEKIKENINQRIKNDSQNPDINKNNIKYKDPRLDNTETKKKLTPLGEKLGTQKILDRIKQNQERLKAIRNKAGKEEDQDEETVQKKQESADIEDPKVGDQSYHSLYASEKEPKTTDLDLKKKEPVNEVVKNINKERIEDTDPKLGSTEMVQPERKLADLEGQKVGVQPFQSLPASEVKPKPPSLDHLNVKPLEDVRVGSRNGPIQNDVNAEEEIAQNPHTDSSNLEKGALGNEVHKTDIDEKLSSTANQDHPSDIQKLDELAPKIIDNFDTATKVLNNVKEIVKEFRKETNNNRGTEADQSTVGKANEEDILTASDLYKNPPNDPDINPPLADPLDASLGEKKTKMIMDDFDRKPLKTSLYKQKDSQPILKADNNADEAVGSEPVEPVLWDKNMSPRMYQRLNQRKHKGRLSLSNRAPEGETVGQQKLEGIPINQNIKVEDVPPTETEETVAENISPNLVGLPSDSNDNIPERINTRFSNNEASGLLGSNLENPNWSKSLGALVPVNLDENKAQFPPSNMYFIGNGIKLPLQMVRNDDGAVHLSVDVDKLCSCKNQTTCLKNDSSAETIVGNQLKRDMELKNELVGSERDEHLLENREDIEANGENSDNESNFEENNSHRHQRQSESSKLLEMKNDIARHLDPNEESMQQDNVNVFKRSSVKPPEVENLPERMTLPIIQSENFENQKEKTADTQNVQLQDKAPNSNLKKLQQFLDNNLIHLKENVKDIGRKYEQTTYQFQKSEEKLINTLGDINSNIQSAKAPVGLHKLKLFKMKPKITVILNKDDSDASPDKEKNIQNKLEELNEHVKQYSKENENFSKRETGESLKKQKSVIKEEVDIMNNILKFFKSLATDGR